MLFYISFSVELSALLMAIGLGLYLVTRSPHRPEAWLAALTSWSMGGLFLNMLLSLMPPLMPQWLGQVLLIFWPKGILDQNPFAWLQGRTSTLASIFWFHATMLLRSDHMKTRQRVVLAGAYGLGLVGLVIQIMLPSQYNSISGDPLFLNSLHAGPAYGLFMLFLVGIAGLSIRNLILAARAEPRYLPRRQLIFLSAATALAGLTGPVGILAAFLQVPVPMFTIAFLLGTGVVLTGIGVARYSALMENRLFHRDFAQTFLGNFAAVVLYLGAVWVVKQLYPFPLSIYILVGVMAVVSHMLIDIARQKTEDHFFQNEKRLLRERLHNLENQNEADLLSGLTHLLDNICKPIQASWAVLLVRSNENYELVAGYRFPQTNLNFPAVRFSVDDLKLLKVGELPDPLSKAALLIPIYLGDQQVGALVFGTAEHGLRYTPIELNGLEEFSDFVAGWLGHLILQRNRQPEQLKQTFPSGLFTGAPDEISIHTVELGLRNLHDYSKLAELPLAGLDLVQPRSGKSSSTIETGKAVHSLLCETLERLRPAGAGDPKSINGVPRRDWYPYIILSDAYIKCRPNREIMDRLYISEGTFNRTRRSAIRSLTRQLVELEKAAIH